MQGSVNYIIENKVATITFFHPQSNSLPGEILNELAKTISLIGEDKDANVIILKSAGDRAFCAGASFDELIAIDNKKDGESFFMGFANVINSMRKCPKIIIGRVQGKTVGGGVGMAASVDYCFATKHASIKLSELAIGIGPFVVGPAVQRKLGVSGMSQLAVNATEWATAYWAMQHGLYQNVFESVEEMDSAIDKLVVNLANSNPEAMKELKQTFWRGCEDWDTLLAERATISGTLVLSNFTRNAISKFKSK